MKYTQGFNIFELLIVLLIAGILVVVAAPSFITYLQTNRLIGTANNLYYSLQNTRSEALKRNATVYVSLQSGTNWCYGFNLGSTCNCTIANNCGLGGVSAANTQLTLTTNGITSNSFRFEPTHGATNISGIITFTTTTGTSTAISVKISMLGNMRVCSSQVSGYQAC